MDKMNLFARLTKVDEARRMVIGRAIEEVVDKADEIFDYATSKPYFEAWSKSFSDATDGKSLGNLRAMHGKIAAGKLTAINFDDTAKAIDIETKIVDEAEWAKVLEGVYTGFSIGGKYVGERKTEKVADKEIKRYTAEPSEISLVDNPCVPSATFFDILKVDGKLEKKAFRPPALDVTGTDDDVAAFADLLRVSGKSVSEAVTVLKREFSEEERKKSAKSGHALPDGSFPIESVSDLHNAIQAFGRAKDKEKAKAHIIARAKALGASKELPESWTKDGSKASEAELQKGMSAVGDFAQVLQHLAYLCREAEGDMQYEGDNSPVPMKFRNWLDDGIEIFKEMAEEEAEEMLEELKEHAGVGEDDEIEEAMEMAAKAGALRKRLDAATAPEDFRKLVASHVTAEELMAAVIDWKPTDGDAGMRERMVKAVMAKVGLSAAHKDKVQAIHDHAADMGADCHQEDGEKATPAGNVNKASDVAAQLSEALERIKKLEAQPMPSVVTLRMAKTITKEQDQERNNAPTIDPDTVELLPADLVRNADGSVDYKTSRLQKAWRLSQLQN